MESTGVYWFPVYAALEGSFDLTVANATHLKKVPGRKTDLSDADWIAQCLSCGLLRKSFIPDQAIRELRVLFRHRTTLVQHRATLVNRLFKDLESAGIKLSNVLSDLQGKSGMAMLHALVKGDQSPAQIAALALGRLKAKKPLIEQALATKLSPSLRFVLGEHLEELERTKQKVEALDAKFATESEPYEATLVLLESIPGVKRVGASGILAEVGASVEAFANEKAFASWTGTTPGQNESGGKKKAAGVKKGNLKMTSLLVELAWGAVRTKGTQWGRVFRKLSAKRGPKRAILAVARRMAEAVYLVLKTGQPWKEPEQGLHPSARQAEIRRLQRQLKKLEAAAAADLTPARQPSLQRGA